MKTVSFIGSDKNAGKTTALNYVYHQLAHRSGERRNICLTSIGINGESTDAYEQIEKPTIRLYPNTFFITAGEHLKGFDGHYDTIEIFKEPSFSKTTVLAVAQTDFSVVIEGPNSKDAVMNMKSVLEKVDRDFVCLIDGSIDRQFLGHPAISDGICFALLITERPEQKAKTNDLIYALTLDSCPINLRKLILPHLDDPYKSLLMNPDGKVVYRGKEIPFLDHHLRNWCLEMRHDAMLLYLNGSLSRSLFDFFAPFENLTLILDNFTCYQNVSTSISAKKVFKPKLMTLHTVPLVCLFLKQESDKSTVELPPQIPVYNLFRDEPHEIGI